MLKEQNQKRNPPGLSCTAKLPAGLLRGAHVLVPEKPLGIYYKLPSLQTCLCRLAQHLQNLHNLCLPMIDDEALLPTHLALIISTLKHSDANNRKTKWLRGIFLGGWKRLHILRGEWVPGAFVKIHHTVHTHKVSILLSVN